MSPRIRCSSIDCKWNRKIGMSIDEIIKKENEIAAEFQKAVDTHIVNDNGATIEEMYCDDTEVIEEHLQRCKVLADYHNQIAETMRKYQKIQELMIGWNNFNAYERMCDIYEVIEDGNESI